MKIIFFYLAGVLLVIVMISTLLPKGVLQMIDLFTF